MFLFFILVLFLPVFFLVFSFRFYYYFFLRFSTFSSLTGIPTTFEIDPRVSAVIALILLSLVFKSSFSA